MTAGLPNADGIDCWVFDLDNTLYSPSECDLSQQMEAAISGFIERRLGVSARESDRLRKVWNSRYGMTLGGLITECGVDPHDYLEETHRLDLSSLHPSPCLQRLVARLPGRRLIHTNANVAHAERVLDRLGLGAHFEAVFDVEAAGFLPKPDPEGYRRLLARHAVDPRRAVMVEDTVRNLTPAAASGMTTVWLRTVRPQAARGFDPAAVHHIVDKLEDWLAAVTG